MTAAASPRLDRLLGDARLRCATARWLPAEASSRRYARLEQLAAPASTSAVLMVFGRGTPPHEVVRVARATELLAAAGVPVPEVLAVEPRDGWILQEDLGDETLAAALAAGRGAVLDAEALGLADRLAPLALDTSPTPPLDAVRLGAELALFARAALSAPARARARRDLEQLVAACAAVPRALCHRDYHARNLMVRDGRLRVLDHQDAMPGPACYDRVSLGYDPYVERTDAERDRLAGLGDGALAPRAIASVAVQRLCKAIGTYATKGKRWRRWIAPAARQARRLLREHRPDLAALPDALAPLAAEPAARSGVPTAPVRADAVAVDPSATAHQAPP